MRVKTRDVLFILNFPTFVKKNLNTGSINLLPLHKTLSDES